MQSNVFMWFLTQTIDVMFYNSDILKPDGATIILHCGYSLLVMMYSDFSPPYFGFFSKQLKSFGFVGQ